MSQPHSEFPIDLKILDSKTQQNSEVSCERSAIINRQIFLKDLEDFLGLEYIKTINTGITPIIIINRARLRDVAQYMSRYRYKLESIWVTDGQKFFEINYWFSNAPYLQNSSIIIQAQNDKSVDIPSIADIYRIAHSFELNITHRMGLQFQIMKKSKLEEEKQKPTLSIPYPIYVESFKNNPIKIGITHPIHQTHYYFDMIIENNIIKQVELRDGWLYKRIQPTLENKNPFTDFTSIFDQISDTAHIHLSIAFLSNLEYLMKKEISNKTKYIRTFIAELERIISHTLWFINLADLLGFSNKAIKIYEEYLILASLCEKYLQSNSLKNVIKYGSALDITMDNARGILHYFQTKSPILFDELYELTYNSFTMEKTKGIGVVSPEHAIKYGLTGPSLRGSGVQIDCRSSDPYLIYTSGELSQIWNVISFKSCDVFARTQVRLWEIRESIEIIKFILQGLSTYERPNIIEPIPEKNTFESDQNLFSQVESPQGRLGIYLRTGIKKTSSNFYTVRLLTPDAKNFAALGHGILINEETRNLPLILHSFDLNFQMIDL